MSDLDGEIGHSEGEMAVSARRDVLCIGHLRGDTQHLTDEMSDLGARQASPDRLC
jgi:hypothetical protein